MSRLLWHIDIFKVFKTHNTVNVCGKIQSQEMLPFLCLLMAARWRHKTSLSRRQHKFPVKEFYCKLSNLQRFLWSLCLIYFSTMKWNLPAKSLPFDLFKLVDVKRECTAVCNLVVSHAFTLFLANTLVLSNVGGSLFKIPPLRSGGTSAQKIK